MNCYIQEPKVPDRLTIWGLCCSTPERTFSSSFRNTWNDLEKVQKDFAFEKKKNFDLQFQFEYLNVVIKKEWEFIILFLFAMIRE